MNFKSYILVALFLVLSGFGVLAQLHSGGTPPGITYRIQESQVVDFMLSISHNKLLQEDYSGIETGVPDRVAVSVPVFADLFSLGSWIELQDGGRFYQVKLRSPGAFGLSAAFERFFIPEHAQLFFYSSDGEIAYGAYTYADNHNSQMFPGPIVEGDEIIIEYFEPVPDRVTEKPVFEIMELAYFYVPFSETEKNSSIGRSDDCQVNINCLEGSEWQDEKRGVARIFLKVGNNYGWCTGSLINNTAQDGTPYFITAEHCGGTADETDRHFWQFRFNFERSGCEEAGVPANQTITGSSLVAKAPMNGSSDMQLLLLHFTPPPTFQPFYNGWDVAVVPAQSGVGIHHPAGDVKKISTFSTTALNVANPVISGISMANSSAWNVIFVQTVSGHSITEGGSSGSPLFNQNKLIVGTLTGGNSSCSFPDGVNIYGKMSYHWESNAGGAENNLKPWLDPIGTGQQTLSGIYLYPFPKPYNLQATLNENLSVTLNWEKPAYSVSDEWYSVANTYSSVRHEQPERAVRYNLSELLITDTFYLKRISHLFWEHPQFLWGQNSRFTFNIYDQDGITLLHQSDTLTALRYATTSKPVIYDLPQPLTVTGEIYVAVALLQSGQPSSLSMEVNHTPQSYYGSPGNWNTLSQNNRNFELLINVYGSTHNSALQMDDFENSDKKLNHQENTQDLMVLGRNYIEWFNKVDENGTGNLKTSFDKTLNLMKQLRIYRNDELINSLSDTELTSFTDAQGLIAGETYNYHVSAIYNLNPANPNAPDLESEKSNEALIRVWFNNLSLRASPSMGGIVEGAGRYSDNSLVAVYASAMAGFEFVGWTLNGQLISSVPDFNYLITGQDVDLVANFRAIDYNLTVTIDPLTSGTIGISPFNENLVYNINEELNLSATSAEGNEFLYWRRDGAYFSGNNPLNFTMPASDVELTARFKNENAQAFNLELISHPDILSARLYGMGIYEESELISVSADEIEGYSFTGWSGMAEDVELLDNPGLPETTFTMPERNVVLAANYVLTDYRLTVQILPEGSGSYSVDPSQEFYNFGDFVTISVISEEGFMFDIWDGKEILSPDNPIAGFFMPASDVIVTANFNLFDYSFSVMVKPFGAANYTINPLKDKYNMGDEIILNTIPNERFKFLNWANESEIVSNTAGFTYTMPSGDVVLTANYEFVSSVVEIEKGKPVLYPNPAAKYINIDSDVLIRKVWIADLSGKLIYHVQTINAMNTLIDVSSFASGVYIIQIITDKNSSSQKLIIQN